MNALAGLRIGLVGPVPPPPGGMAMQTRQLAELLRRERADVVLVPTNAPYRPAWIASLRGVRALFRLVPYLVALWRAAGRSDVMHVMANSGWSWHLFAAPAIWVGRLRRVPVVVNYRGGEAADFLRRSAGLVRASMRRAAGLVVPSRFLQQVFGEHRMPAQVVPNIVDTELFRPSPQPPTRQQLIVARRLEPIYDNATALRAFAQVVAEYPQARLVLAGDGPEEASLRQLADELGVTAQVEFAGALDRDAIAARLRESSVSINPSRVDNMPNSVLEALACGVPVVSTRVGGVPFVVDDGETALLVPPGDPDAMARAIVRLLRDPALAKRLRDAGLAVAEQYRWVCVSPLWDEVYRRAVRAGSPN
ncbi:MAG: glycosyltransferase family 4 protein [Rubrivivax sp.]|nr:glycosyltransferase family 4 protein [Rubrivivax sp.]